MGSKTIKQTRLTATLLALALLTFVQPAAAHVKWFSDFSFADRPLTYPEVINPIYLGLVGLSVVVIGSMVFLERRLNGFGWYQAINRWFTERQHFSVPVMRVAMAATLLISWANDAVLTPELITGSFVENWLQFVLAILLLFQRTTPIAGAGLVVLYLLAMLEFGFFHMLDYLHYVGIGIYLLTSDLKDERLRGLGLPALYATIGFSLIWLGYEKLVYPEWGLYLLDQNPQLALGFPPDFFLQGAAFVEISLGYLLIIGLLERPLAATITLVFFSTTLIFGKLEVIGHTPLHAALVLFLFNGPGYVYKPPIAIHERISWRTAFAGVNFVLAVVIFGFGYTFSAQQQYRNAVAAAPSNAHSMAVLDLAGEENIPDITSIELIPETAASNSYNLRVTVDNFTFTPEETGEPASPNSGHAHIYVNGEQVGRMYGEWAYLGAFPPGEYEIAVTLNGNDHTEFVVNGQLIAAETTLVVE